MLSHLSIQEYFPILNSTHLISSVSSLFCVYKLLNEGGIDKIIIYFVNLRQLTYGQFRAVPSPTCKVDQKHLIASGHRSLHTKNRSYR